MLFSPLKKLFSLLKTLFPYTRLDMSNSAFVGQPPATIEDQLIIRGYVRTLGVIENNLDATEVFPSYAAKSIDGANEVSKNSSIITCMSLAIALISLMAGTRLCLRVFWKDLSMGYDDFVIIPAAIGALSWCSLMIALATYGGAGKSIYDITYCELDYFYRVSLCILAARASQTS